MIRIKRLLPENCYSTRPLKIKGLVVHYISAKYTNPANMFGVEEICAILEEYKLSYHYLIARDGTVYQLTPDTNRAYHAGKSELNGHNGCNKFTLGVAVVGTSDLPFNTEQLIALAQLTASKMTEYDFGVEWVAKHSTIRDNFNKSHPNNRAPTKPDPGPMFPWSSYIDMIRGASPLGEENGNN